jgi:hypothetical protein
VTQPTDGSTAQQVKDQVKDAARTTEDRARSAAGQARQGLRDQVDRRSTQAGERISAQAGDVRSVAEELRRQGKDTPARLADQLAERAEQFAGYLERADGDRILRDVEGYARRNRWAVVAGGLVVGFAASRFLKASSGQRYRASVAQPYGTSQRDEPWQPAPAPDAPVIRATEPPVGGTVEPAVAEPMSRPGDPGYDRTWPASDRPAAPEER